MVSEEKHVNVGRCDQLITLQTWRSEYSSPATVDLVGLRCLQNHHVMHNVESVEESSPTSGHPHATIDHINFAISRSSRQRNIQTLSNHDTFIQASFNPVRKVEFKIKSLDYLKRVKWQTRNGQKQELPSSNVRCGRKGQSTGKPYIRIFDKSLKKSRVKPNSHRRLFSSAAIKIINVEICTFFIKKT